MRVPVIVLNFKGYTEICGEKGLNLAKNIEPLAILSFGYSK